MKKILVIQSRHRPEMIEAERGEYTRAANGAAELVFISALDEFLSWNEPAKMLRGFDGVMFGGSGEFDLHSESEPEIRMTPARAILLRLKPFIAYLIEND